jgi:hypothetical protein
MATKNHPPKSGHEQIPIDAWGAGLVPHLRHSDHVRDLAPVLPGLAHVLAVGPPGHASMGISQCRVFLNPLKLVACSHGKLHGVPGQVGQVGRQM